MAHPAEPDPDPQESHQGASVGARIRDLRLAAGLTLSELARRAGIGKGTLSELEAGRRNPTLDTLYALTVPLGVGLATLLVAGPPAAGGRPGAHPAIAGSGVVATLLDALSGPGGATLEVYRLVIQSGLPHRSPGHGRGVFEQLTLATGRAVVGPVATEQEVGPGASATWSSEGPHSYRALDGDSAVGVLIITYAAQRP